MRFEVRYHGADMDDTVKAVAFDIDGTLVESNFWPALNALSGLSEKQDKQWFKDYHEKRLDYITWTNNITASFTHPQSRETVEKLATTYTLAPHAREAVEFVISAYPVALISSNVDAFVLRVAEDLGIEHAYWFTQFEYHNDVFKRIGFSTPHTELETKIRQIDDFAKKCGFAAHEIAFVGDSRNDLDAFIHTGKGILVGEGNAELRAAAWKRINALSELRDIL